MRFAPRPGDGPVHDGLVMICDVDLDVPDGARTHTIEVARGFARAGLAVELIARGSDPNIPGVRFEAARGGEHERIMRAGMISARGITALWRGRRAARRFYVRHKWTTMPATVFARLLGYRVVTEVDDVPYGPGYEGEISPVVDYLNRAMTVLMGRVSHGVVAGTAEAKELLAREFRVPRERIGIVAIGVDVEYFHPLVRATAINRAGLDPSHRYLLFIGHFASWVDFDTLLGAFAFVVRWHPDVRLLLVGDGAERSRIEALARRLSIEHAVILTGFVSERDRIRDLLGAATVALASHRAEHLDRIGMNATKLAEYLASGRPIVATDVARLRQMIEEPGAGIVVPEDPEAMARAISGLLEPGRADELGAVARRLAEARYSWEATVRDTLALFGTASR
jgi:glycosyltransferase involved in cell wall biosynthesis